MVLGHRKHVLAGVPENHFAVEQDGRRFYVPRGGGPIEAREQTPMTAEQHRAWVEGGRASLRWAMAGAGFLVTLVAGVLGWKFLDWLQGLSGPTTSATASQQPGGEP